VLIGSLTTHQRQIYVAYTAVGRTLIPRIRKLANHTLSQSVPQSVTSAISSYLKVFLGEVIEEARRVQIEWQAAEEKFPDGTKVPEDATLRDRIKPEWRGPLTPDHLREALRRIKRDRRGGGGGHQGVSLMGKERTAPKMDGRRLFK
jgi:transcription initiation factor TFIID subunit 11